MPARVQFGILSEDVCVEMLLRDGELCVGGIQGWVGPIARRDEAAMRRLVCRKDVHEQGVGCGPRSREEREKGQPLPTVAAANIVLQNVVEV